MSYQRLQMFSMAAREAEVKRRKEDAQARRNRLSELVNQLGESIIRDLPDPERLEDEAQKGHSFITVFTFYPPSSDVDPSKMYFSGKDSDPTQGGVPIIALVNGFRKEGRSDPSTLPDGMTVINYLNKRAQEVESLKGITFESQFFRRDGKMENRIVMIWDHEGWRAYQERREARRKAQREERREARRDIGLDEHLKNEEERRRGMRMRVSAIQGGSRRARQPNEK